MFFLFCFGFGFFCFVLGGGGGGSIFLVGRVGVREEYASIFV